MSRAAAEVSVIGLEALDLAVAGKKGKRKWLDRHLEGLAAARKPHGQTELMIVDPVVDLVCAAALPASLTAEGCRKHEETAVGGEH